MTDRPSPPRPSRMGAVRAWMKSRRRLRDDAITVGITVVITLIFIVYTILAWPHPFRLGNFSLELHGPLKNLSSPDTERPRR